MGRVDEHRCRVKKAGRQAGCRQATVFGCSPALPASPGKPDFLLAGCLPAAAIDGRYCQDIKKPCRQLQPAGFQGSAGILKFTALKLFS
tara:strand:- start:313 stop:579 length:267 start_codon:yes stop_codon:yes gene_type:complete